MPCREDGPVEPSHGDLRWEWVRTFNIESDRPAHRHTQLDRMRAELQVIAAQLNLNEPLAHHKWLL